MDVLINGCSQAWERQKAFLKVEAWSCEAGKNTALFNSSKMPQVFSLWDKLLWYTTNQY